MVLGDIIYNHADVSFLYNYITINFLYNFIKIFFTVEIMHSAVHSLDSACQLKLFGPKPIVMVKKLTEKVIAEITAGIWALWLLYKSRKIVIHAKSSRGHWL